MTRFLAFSVFFLGLSFNSYAGISCKVTKISNSAPPKNCLVSIDPQNPQDTYGTGAIQHTQSIGNLLTDCEGFPADYNFQKKRIKTFPMWDQGITAPDEAKRILDYLSTLGYDKNGNLGFKLSDVASLHGYAGGTGAMLNFIYEAFDANNNHLGYLLVAGYPSAILAFEGCYQ